MLLSLLIINLDSLGHSFLLTRMKQLSYSQSFAKRFKMKKGFEITTIRTAHGGEFNCNPFENIVMKIILNIIFLHQEHLNKMGLLGRKIELRKKWGELFFVKTTCQNTFGQRKLTQLALF